MFWRKTIKRLKVEVEYQKSRADRAWEIGEKTLVDRKLEYEKLAIKLESINQALADENRQLAWQLELYKALLKQLQIPIKLPVRAK